MSKREFQYTDTNSNKFWTIALEGSSHVVNYGRIGTTGQSLTKEFTSPQEAQKSYEALIRTKLKEGYQELIGEIAPTPQPIPVEPAKIKEVIVPPLQAAPVIFQTIELVATHSINLTDTDWLFATWRERKPRPWLPPVPFNKEQALKKLEKISTSQYGWKWNWQSLKIPDLMTREEAHFWYLAMIWQERDSRPDQLCKKLAKETLDGNLSLAKVLEEFWKKQLYDLNAEILKPMVNLFPVKEIMESATNPTRISKTTSQQGGTYSGYSPFLEVLIEGFRSSILAYLSATDLKEIQEMVRPLLASLNYSSDPPYFYLLAAQLGMYEEITALVESWADDEFSVFNFYYAYSLNNHYPQLLVLGLGEPEEVVYHMQRLGLPLSTANIIKGWIAHTEYSNLEYITSGVIGATSIEQAELLLKAFAGSMVAPEAAYPILKLKSASKAPYVAREWMDQHPAEVIVGLVPAAAGKEKLAEAAREQLKLLARKGYQEFIIQELERLAPEVAKKLKSETVEGSKNIYPPFDDNSTPLWLKEALTSVVPTKSKLPGWAVPSLLPPVVSGKFCFNESQLQYLLMALQQSSLETPHPFITAIIQADTDRKSLDNVAWAIFQTWLEDGAPTKEKWALAAVGLLGNDTSALKLAPLVKVWPGEGQHQRAVLGLECLKAIGTDAALMQINGIAQKVQFKALKEKAQESMNRIAETRNMTRAQLEDRIVPDCDLDEQGTTVFDFGSRKFYFALGPNFNPLVRDEAGKPKPDLPKPNTSDDAVLANASIERWKLIKKQVREVSKIQLVRLEQAMVMGRRWSDAEFESLLVHHPLMTHLVRLVVWGCYDSAGKLTAAFRVTEDQSYADVNDETFTLAPGSQLGIVHPLHIAEEERVAWGQLFSDYEIISPFPQLGRPVYRLEKGEADQKEITRFRDIKIPAITVVGTLDKLGWERAIPADAGGFSEHSKPFYGSNVTAIVSYEEGVAVGWITDAPDQRLTSCFFLPGIYTPKMYPDHKKSLPLSEVHEVVISEVLTDLSSIAAKGK